MLQVTQAAHAPARVPRATPLQDSTNLWATVGQKKGSSSQPAASFPMPLPPARRQALKKGKQQQEEEDDIDDEEQEVILETQLELEI